MQLKKVVTASLAVLLMAGCSSTPQVNEKLENAREALAGCLSPDGFHNFYRNCNANTLKELPQESQLKASEKWSTYLAGAGPDFQLLAAVKSGDLKGVTEAIDAGADVNRLFTDATLYGSGAYDPDDKNSILTIASKRMNLELMAVLFEAGADVNLRYGPERNLNDFVYQSFGKMRSTYDGNSQKIVVTAYGPDIGLLALEYGYAPTAYILDAMANGLIRGSDPKMKAKQSELYNKLLQARNEAPQQMATASEFGFHKHLTVDEVLANQMPKTSGMQQLQIGMEVNMRCLASLATFRNILNPATDTNMINKFNQNIGYIMVLTAANYDRLTHDGELSRSDWSYAKLLDMFESLSPDLGDPYLSYYEKLLQQVKQSEVATRRYRNDIDTCTALASKYKKAMKDDPEGSIN
jgi:hypothetical protein